MRPEQRFPGLDVLAQARHWDPATRRVVLSRMGPFAPGDLFTPKERATARALLAQLLDLPAHPHVPVVELVEQRLAAGRTDGWRYGDLPEDTQAWRLSLTFLDDDADRAHGRPFAGCTAQEQAEVIQAVQSAPDTWHGWAAQHVWSLWTRYACTAFYSHPHAWAEIGFPGPAYPRGYKNAGVGRREPFEVADAMPGDDPVPGDR